MTDVTAADENLLAEVPAPGEGMLTPHNSAKLRAVIFIALVAIAFTIGFFLLTGELEHLIWTEDLLAPGSLAIPAFAILFSLVVGLSRRYLRAPSSIHGGMTEEVRGDADPPDYRQFPGALVSAIATLLSGVSVGPEGMIGVLVTEISAFVRSRLKITGPDAAGYDLAAIASAFNGIIGGVLFTGLLATELQSGRTKSPLRCVVWNLIAGAIGFAVMVAAGLSPFAQSMPFPPTGLSLLYVLVAILCGGVATVIAVGTGIWLKTIETVLDRVFDERVVLRALAGGVVVGAVCFVFPDLLFSGETQIHTFINDPALYGAALLLLLAVLKIGLFGISIKAGYIGGPIFPIIFACTLVGLALSLLFPGIPVAVFVLCIEAGAIAVALGAPITAVLLVAILSVPDQSTIVLIVFSIATALLLTAEVKKLNARRSASGAGTAGTS
jgi:H+/Cl- antiporter ClcA